MSHMYQIVSQALHLVNLKPWQNIKILKIQNGMIKIMALV